jgi:hypothetical protein
MRGRNRKEWNTLIQDVMKSSNMADFRAQIPNVCLSVRKVIPYLTLLKDEIDLENANIIRAKKAFQCSSLFATAIFQSTAATSSPQTCILFHGFATAMRVNADIMQYFTCPDLLAMVVIGHIGHLEQYGPLCIKLVSGKRSRKDTFKPHIVKCLSNLFSLALSLLPLFRPEDREQFLHDLQAHQTSGLESFIDKYSIIDQVSRGTFVSFLISIPLTPNS